MWKSPGDFAGRPELVDDAVRTFVGAHGFRGFHVRVFDEWYRLGAPGPDDHASATPDPATFEALEMLIARAHAAGGIVHLWFTGDCENDRCSRWRPGSPEQRRLLDYIAARLGPLPGWTMGFGADIEEDHTREEVESWHAFLDRAIPWPHWVGARTGRDFVENGLYRTDGVPLCEGCDYESWVDHKPSYADLVRIVDRNPAEPCLLEDRFRIRDEGRIKDFTMDETRRGLWRAAMAGGCGGIWGNLLGAPASGASAPYPRADQLLAFRRFWDGRFTGDLMRCRADAAESAACLTTPDRERVVLYAEASAEVEADLRWLARPRRGFAFDARDPSAALDVGIVSPGPFRFVPPRASDWIVSIGG